MPVSDDFPDPSRAYPVTLPDGEHHRGTVFLDQMIAHPNFHVGAYSYASDFDPPDDWAGRLAPYLFQGGAEHLHIGKFCQIAHGVRFITSGANHDMAGLTTFPFPIFDSSRIASYQPDRRDTRVGHDVWLGYGAMVLPGARIGTGAIIGAGAVVRGTVPPYAIVTGNPGGVVRMRFDQTGIERLQKLAWWDWPKDVIAAAKTHLLGGDLDALERCAPSAREG